METDQFNPLDKRNLGISIADAIFRQNIYPLKELEPFNGAGVYAIYYNGEPLKTSNIITIFLRS